MPTPQILVVDDDQLQRWALCKELKRWGYQALEAGDGRSAIDAFGAHLPDLVLLDFQLPDADGVSVLRRIKEIDPKGVVIMVTAHGGVDEAVSAFRIGLFDYLSKPIDFDALRVAVRFGLEARQLRDEVQRWREHDRGESDRVVVIGSSPAVTSAVALLQKVAASSASTVLLTGESGTGKDLFAKALHYGGPFAGGPFISVNCAAIPETLLESELFGHERGAFTDAGSLKKGVFELADGGTLYLDEIAELKPALQAKLLRVLETLTFRRLGGTRDISVQLRVVAATNRDLDLAVNAGEFRPDLLYRLKVIEMCLPPLRTHPDDIPLLVEHFVQTFAVRFRKPIVSVTPDAMASLRAYHWPGNVRELRNALERAVILEESDRLTAVHLPESVLRSRGAPAATPQAGFVLPPEGVSLEAVEESLVRQALALADGNQIQAARLLAISRDTFRYRLKKFGLGGGSRKRDADQTDPPPATSP